MDPTGGIKVHRGAQDGVTPPSSGYVQGVYNQFTHMKGSGEGNFVVSHSPVSNAMTLKIIATTNVGNTLSTTLLNPEDLNSAIVHPSIQMGVYGGVAMVVDETNRVGIGTLNSTIPIASKLTVVSGSLSGPPNGIGPNTPGSALTVYEGITTSNRVLVSVDDLGAATWGKVDSTRTEGASGTFTTVNGKTVTVTKGLITNIA